MSVTRGEFLHEVKDILQPALETRSYLLSLPPIARNSMVWFEKKPDPKSRLYRIVELQPSGFSQNEIIKVAINLQRRSYRDYDDPPKVAVETGNDLFVRLSPRLWAKENSTMDYWWHLSPPDQLVKVFKDILAKIIDFGIPFLEDEKSSQSQWFGKP